MKRPPSRHSASALPQVQSRFGVVFLTLGRQSSSPVPSASPEYASEPCLHPARLRVGRTARPASLSEIASSRHHVPRHLSRQCLRHAVADPVLRGADPARVLRNAPLPAGLSLLQAPEEQGHRAGIAL